MAGVVLGVHAGLMHEALAVWRSDLTLWRHAAQVAPQKPRVLVNYGVSLIQARVIEAGTARLVQAERASRLPHVPRPDAVVTWRSVDKNFRGLGLR